MILRGNAIVGQSGGPTSVINSSLYGIIKQSHRQKVIEKLFGAVNGIEGILSENLVSLFDEPQKNLDNLKKLPGSVLGGCRYMLKSEEYENEDIKVVFNVFDKYNIRYFFYIGGNDSMDTANKINKAAKKLNYDLRVIGIPKTIDNDLPGTDHCPGYGSCSKYIITSVLESGIHARSMSTSEPVTILVTVGRNAGWLPAASCLAKRCEEDAPHLVCFPEVPFDKVKFISDVERVYNQIGSVFIVTGEGLRDRDGKYISAKFDGIAQDSFGHAELGSVAETMKQLIEDELRLKTRYIKPDICQQAAMHMASNLDIKEAEMCGRAAVRFAVKGISGVMVSINRFQEQKYKTKLGMVDLSEVANIDRLVPKEFINEEGNFVSSRFIDYLKPLIEGTVKVRMKDGFPIYSGLDMVKVNKF